MNGMDTIRESEKTCKGNTTITKNLIKVMKHGFFMYSLYHY